MASIEDPGDDLGFHALVEDEDAAVPVARQLGDDVPELLTLEDQALAAPGQRPVDIDALHRDESSGTRVGGAKAVRDVKRRRMLG
jgi:hypothetical protein